MFKDGKKDLGKQSDYRKMHEQIAGEYWPKNYNQ